MENHFGNLSDKIKAIREIQALGIDSDQAVDIVFESIQENERIQFIQEVFKIAFMYGQKHELNKRSADYSVSDENARNQCINYCTKIIS